MKIIENKARENEYMILGEFYNLSEILLFDIETTGFTAETTSLYLIGCAYFQGNEWFIRQWFNDDGASERDILVDFLKFANNYKYIMHYNGDGFDLPYISKKIKANKLTGSELSDTLKNLESVDLYKLLKPFKETFHVDNLKQKSIEKYLGINRLDKYTGGDLIKVYTDYLKNNSETGKQLLLQHNYEDLEGLLYTSSLIGVCRFKAGCFTVRKMSVRQERLLFSLSLDYTLPKRITLGTNDIIITAYLKEATVNVPIITDTLKFFFDNYREYYYLPAEDMAVHKSVATYVDKNYRQPATKKNCYVKRYGHYISQIDSGILSGYKREYDDKETYIELVDSFLQDMDMLNAYARYVISKLL
jgi:hypothetical protein